MATTVLLPLICGVLAVFSVALVKADDPYRYYTWTVTYGTLSPLGVPQQVGLVAVSGMSKCSIAFSVSGFLKVSNVFFSVLQVILINGQFPGPSLDVVTNDNIILNLINKLDEPFLLTW